MSEGTEGIWNSMPSFDMGSIAFILLIFFLAVLVVALIGIAIFLHLRKKQLKYKIPLLKKVGNRVIKIGDYKAKDFKIGLAGDFLWFIPKLKKYISCGTIQTAPNEFTHFQREDGELINIGYPDIDEKMKEIGVKYVHQDMRSTRIAISNILEQRFKGKESFWEKYGHLITHVIFYLVVCVALVVIFYQFSEIVNQIAVILDKVIAYEELKCPQNIVPAFLPLLLWRFREKWIG